MYSRTAGIVIFLLVVAALLISALYYPRLPDTIASHWDGSGRVDGYMSKSWGLFFLPAMMFVLWLVFTIVPHIAPARPVIPRGSRHVGLFIIVLFTFLDVIHFQVIQWNLGNEIPFTVTIPVGLGALFFSIGSMLGHLEPNWVVGIRTYWTLKSRVVWEQTHERASLLFKILGFIYLGAAFFRDYILLFILLPALFVALYLVAYSFILYQKIEKGDM